MHLTGSSALSRQGQGRETRPQAKAHRASMQGGDPSARQGRGVAGRDWPQLQRERMDDREARAMTRKTLFGTPPAKRTKRLPPGMVCNRLARRPSIALPHVDNDGDFCERGGGSVTPDPRSARRGTAPRGRGSRVAAAGAGSVTGVSKPMADGSLVDALLPAEPRRGRNAEGSRHSLYGGTAPTADIGHTSTIVVVTIAMSLLRCIS